MKCGGGHFIGCIAVAAILTGCATHFSSAGSGEAVAVVRFMPLEKSADYSCVIRRVDGRRVRAGRFFPHDIQLEPGDHTLVFRQRSSFNPRSDSDGGALAAAVGLGAGVAAAAHGVLPYLHSTEGAKGGRALHGTEMVTNVLSVQAGGLYIIDGQGRLVSVSGADPTRLVASGDSAERYLQHKPSARAIPSPVPGTDKQSRSN